MYTSVNTAQVLPGQMEQAISLYQKTVPLVKQLPGVQSVTLMVNRTANTLVTIAIYDTQEHAQVIPSGELLEAVRGLRAVIAAEPDRQWHDVVDQK